MRGLFIHDHKFPCHEGKFYHSYGFDGEFFNRYLNIFEDLGVIGRQREAQHSEITEAGKVKSDISFLTVNNLKQLKNKEKRALINEKIKKSDYVVIRVPSILGLYAARIAKKYKKPYLIEVVGCSWDAISNKGISKLLPALLITYLTKRAIRSTNYAVYVTEEFLEKRYPTKGKHIACSNVTLKSVNENDLKKRLNKINKFVENKKVIMGTCATVDVSYKGQQDVIAAIARLKNEGHDIEYQLVGGGDQTYLKSVAEQFGVRNQVNFLGSLNHEDVFNWLEQIDIYVHPSKQEGLSRAIIEAMSKGCPILGADAGGIHELIENRFVFNKGDIEQICDIYKKFDMDIMREQATKNHHNSKNYLKSVLYKRRKDFFNKFIEESKI